MEAETRAQLADLRERLEQAEKNEDTEQMWLLRKAISELADRATVEEASRR